LELILRVLASLICTLPLFRSRVVLPVVHGTLLAGEIITIHIA
jgi:hypothetical protein